LGEEHLVPGIPDHGAFLWKRLERVSGNEPGGFDVVFFEELEEAADPDGAGPETARDVAGGVLAAVGAEPAGDSVNVDAVGAEDALDVLVSKIFRGG
jgi:hypothetical protein